MMSMRRSIYQLVLCVVFGCIYSSNSLDCSPDGQNFIKCEVNETSDACKAVQDFPTADYEIKKAILQDAYMFVNDSKDVGITVKWKSPGPLDLNKTEGYELSYWYMSLNGIEEDRPRRRSCRYFKVWSVTRTVQNIDTLHNFSYTLYPLQSDYITADMYIELRTLPEPHSGVQPTRYQISIRTAAETTSTTEAARSTISSTTDTRESSASDVTLSTGPKGAYSVTTEKPPADPLAWWIIFLSVIIPCLVIVLIIVFAVCMRTTSNSRNRDGMNLPEKFVAPLKSNKKVILAYVAASEQYRKMYKVLEEILNCYVYIDVDKYNGTGSPPDKNVPVVVIISSGIKEGYKICTTPQVYEDCAALPRSLIAKKHVAEILVQKNRNNVYLIRFPHIDADFVHPNLFCLPDDLKRFLQQSFGLSSDRWNDYENSYLHETLLEAVKELKNSPDDLESLDTITVDTKNIPGTCRPANQQNANGKPVSYAYIDYTDSSAIAGPLHGPATISAQNEIQGPHQIYSMQCDDNSSDPNNKYEAQNSTSPLIDESVSVYTEYLSNSKESYDV